MRQYLRLPPLLLLSLVSICCCGCIVVPIRVPTKTVGTTGDTGKKVDLSFLVTGTTPRNEVAQRLAWVDSGIKDDRFFVARWTQSTWGIAWAVGGYYAAEAGWNRSWTIRNLVVQFDQQGLAEKFSFVDDDKLAETLTQLISQNSPYPLDSQLPCEIHTDHIHFAKHTWGTLTLSAHELKFVPAEDSSHGAHSYFSTPRANVIRVSTGSWSSSTSTSPAILTATIHFRQKTSVGTKFSTKLDLPNILVLLRYVHQPQPNPTDSPEGGGESRACSQ